MARKGKRVGGYRDLGRGRGERSGERGEGEAERKRYGIHGRDTLYTTMEESRQSVAVELKPIEKTSLVF